MLAALALCMQDARVAVHMGRACRALAAQLRKQPIAVLGLLLDCGDSALLRKMRALDRRLCAAIEARRYEWRRLPTRCRLPSNAISLQLLLELPSVAPWRWIRQPWVGILESMRIYSSNLLLSEYPSEFIYLAQELSAPRSTLWTPLECLGAAHTAVVPLPCDWWLPSNNRKVDLRFYPTLERAVIADGKCPEGAVGKALLVQVDRLRGDTQ